MRFARLGNKGAEVPVLVQGERYLDLRGVIDDLQGPNLSAQSLRSIASVADTLPELPGAAELRVGAPVARPGAVFCIGLNYVGHAKESNAPLPDLPILFLKTPNTVGGPSDDVDIPRGSKKTDWEVELGVVIGDDAHYLDSPADARRYVAGFVAANDLSERAFQLEDSGGPWSKGKCAPGFTPLGPWLVTTDELSPDDLRLRSWVNGEPRQDGSTSDLIFGVDYIVWHLSQYLALEPGDVILTGTPQGVAASGRFPFLREGDVVEVEVDGLGRQRQFLGQA